MKLICPNCQDQSMVDASADARLSSTLCARCGTLLQQPLWPSSQSSPLETTTTAAAPFAVVDQGIMENQNAYAPSAETLGEDVLEIPRPLRSTQHAGEQTLVLEDVIPVPPLHELSLWEEGINTQMQYGITSEPDTLLSDDDDETTLVSASPSASRIEGNRLAVTEAFGAAQGSAPDYEGYRAWVRIAPLLLLLGALAFFSLYYLGNRMADGSRDTAQNSATNPDAQPPTETAAPAATSPQSVESAQPATTTEPPPAPATAQPSESSLVGASAETQKPDEKSKVEAAKTETSPVAVAPVAAPAAPAVTAPAPSTSSSPAATTTAQGVGNFTVQVGSYNDAAQAEERAGRLRSSGIEARVVRAEIPRRGTWYRVQAGRFASQAEATRYASEIKGKGATDDFIITAVQ